MFRVTTPKNHYFFDTEYDASLFARAKSKKLKDPVSVVEVKTRTVLSTYQGGESFGKAYSLFVK